MNNLVEDLLITSVTPEQLAKILRVIEKAALGKLRGKDGKFKPPSKGAQRWLKKHGFPVGIKDDKSVKSKK